MSLPSTMTAIEISTPGGPGVLVPTKKPIPKPGPNDVLIKVEAAGVNRPDCMQRAGVYPAPPGASALPGLEAAGEVVAIGDKVSMWEIGDKVTALTAGGAYAQYAIANAKHCLVWPKGYDALKAAALPETYFTVWTNVFDRGRLQAGEKFLVHGGSSGIGSTAIQLAKAFGAEVATTAGSAEKCVFCTELGADLAINYREEDWQAAIKEWTDRRGVDVILDMVAGPYIQGGIDSLAKDGRYLFLAFLKGPKAEINFTRVLTDRLTLSGSTLRPQSDAAKAAIAKELAARVWPLLDSGKITPTIHATFPLEQANEAHKLMESSTHMGKIMLDLQ